MKKPKLATSFSAYRAVSVQAPTVGACEAATTIRNHRYLSAEAPLLPLTDCAHPTSCRCKYKHWDDRRQQDDRRSPVYGLADQLHAATDRRSGSRDRRKNS